MRIAITADLHLTTQQEHPERFAAMQDVLRQCGQLELDWLIVAGDLFDRSQRNFADFEQAYAEAHPEHLPVSVIAGNHDSDLQSGALAGEGLEVLAEPTLRPAGEEFQLLLVPYAAGSSMGAHLPPFRSQLSASRWALVSHGDWTAGRRPANPYEPGTYMPLTRSDVETYQPAIVLLGHIHAPTDQSPIHYPGSPCPLDINETGLRRFLIFDTETGSLTPQPVDSDRLYFNETIVMLPVDDEPGLLHAELERRIASWKVPTRLQDRIQVRLRIVGYAANRAAIEAAARQALDDFTLYDGGPDLSDLNLATDADRIHIARQVREWIDGVAWADRQSGGAGVGPEPTDEQIALEALRVIWGD